MSTKTKRSFSAFILFFVLLCTVYYIHITFVNVDVVFYAAIIDGIIATMITGTALFVLNYFKYFNKFEKLQFLIIWFILGYSFAISVPTVIDRSLSFYILEKLDQRGGGIQQERLEEVFTKEYVKEHRLIDVRLTEQLESGTIIIKNGCIRLTKKGELIANFGRFYRKNFLPKKRLLMGEYSDDLTDPFRNSEDHIGYECE